MDNCIACWRQVERCCIHSLCLLRLGFGIGPSPAVHVMVFSMPMFCVWIFWHRVHISLVAGLSLLRFITWLQLKMNSLKFITHITNLLEVVIDSCFQALLNSQTRPTLLCYMLRYGDYLKNNQRITKNFGLSVPREWIVLMPRLWQGAYSIYARGKLNRRSEKVDL